MSLGVKQNKIYLNIKEGKISHKSQTGEESLYDYVEGSLVGISKRDREFKGETVVYWYIDLLGETGELYSLSIHYSSGVAKAILNSLASVDVLGKIRIETYQSGDFTKTIVYNNGERLNWKYPELPPIEDLRIGDKIIKDDSKRMILFNEIAQDLVNKVNIVI
jgi:hypothetical protein